MPAPTGISELARKKGVSRQYIWAQQKKAAGLCIICAKKRTNSNNFCEKHRLLANKLAVARHHKKKRRGS